MSVPKGRNCRIEIAATFSTAKTITAITKANPGQVTSAAHGLTAGAAGFYTMPNGMSELDNMAGSVQGVAAGTWNIERVDTTNFGTFTAGSFTPAATWNTLSTASGYSVAGGDADEVDVATLLDSNHKIEYGLLAAETVSIDHLSDTQLTAAIQVEEAARNGTALLFRVTLSNTERRLFYGIPSLPGETVALSQAATGSFKVAVKGRVLKLPVAS
jgi:hypothetical protein